MKKTRALIARRITAIGWPSADLQEPMKEKVRARTETSLQSPAEPKVEAVTNLVAEAVAERMLIGPRQMDLFDRASLKKAIGLGFLVQHRNCTQPLILLDSIC